MDGGLKRWVSMVMVGELTVCGDGKEELIGDEIGLVIRLDW